MAVAGGADKTHRPPALQPPVHLKVASWSAPAGTPRLRTDSKPHPSRPRAETRPQGRVTAEGVEDAGESEGSAVMAEIGLAKAGNTRPERAQTSGGSQRKRGNWTSVPIGDVGWRKPNRPTGASRWRGPTWIGPRRRPSYGASRTGSSAPRRWATARG